MKKIILFLIIVIAVLNSDAQNVIRGEYFIDADPGFGNATPFVITAPAPDITQLITIPYNSFSTPGYHFVYTRVQDADGSWSVTTRKHIEADESPFTLNTIQVEYFFDSDAGFGNNLSVALIPATDSTWTFDIPFNQLPFVTNDTLFLRVLDNPKSSWSITTLVDSLNIVVTGVDEFNEAVFSMYPNPVNTTIHLQFKNNTPFNYTIFNAIGKEYAMENRADYYSEIDVHDLMPGIYFLKIISSDKTYIKKFVKQ